jgi:hypothetical protein
MRHSTRVPNWLSTRANDPLVRYGLVLLAIQLVWRASITAGSYFWQDDFRFLSDVQDGLTADVVLQRYNGHLMPGKYVSAWLISGAGNSFTSAGMSIIFGQALVGFLMLWVLVQLFPSPWSATASTSSPLSAWSPRRGGRTGWKGCPCRLPCWEHWVRTWPFGRRAVGGGSLALSRP